MCDIESYKGSNYLRNKISTLYCKVIDFIYIFAGNNTM